MKRTGYTIIVLTACLALFAGCKKQQPEFASWAAQIKSISQIKSIRVYDLEGLYGLDYSRQDLKDAVQAGFNPRLFRELASEARFRNEAMMWKGSRLAVVTMNDGTEKRLALSYYGGIYIILGQKGYFVFEGEARKKWDEAFQKDIMQDNFIPKRKGIGRNSE